MKYDYLIVGAGLFGATFAHFATKAGRRCLVIDRRPHTGGNVYCEKIEGINVHKYGAHIFHTSDKAVWDFVNSIVPFNRYTNCPVAAAPDGRIYNLPFNMNTFYQLWGVRTPAEAQARLDEQRREALECMATEGVTDPRNLEEQALSLIGRDIYELLIKHYTEKQWGRPCTELPAFIIRRLPVRLTFDNNYFNDDYQGIPVGGYNRLIDGLLQGCDVQTCIDFKDIQSTWRDVADKLVYTGAIDEYFDFSLGRLDWRTVSFETEVKETPNWQGNAVVNYTDHLTKFTRIIEHKHFEFGQQPFTVITREYPQNFTKDSEPYYPINDDKNSAILQQYKAKANLYPQLLTGGRLGQYAYFDMDDTIEAALQLAAKEFNLK